MKRMPRIRDVERIMVDVPFTPRCQEWNAREVWQWRISEVIRLTTDTPVDEYGHGEAVAPLGAAGAPGGEGGRSCVCWMN